MTDELIFSLIIAGCLIPVGLFIFAYYFPLRLFARRNWPSTGGVITFADVEDYYSKTSKYQVTSITYNYHVSGEEFSAVQEIPYRRSYQIGDPVTIYYDPTRPQESYVELLLHMGIIRSVVGFVLLVIGILVIYLEMVDGLILVGAWIVIGYLLSIARKAIWGRHDPGKRN